MLNKQQVMTLLQSVIDPTLNKTLAKTNGVKAIEIDQLENAIRLNIAIGEIEADLHQKMEEEITDKFNRVGIDTVEIRFEALSSEELEEIQAREKDPASLLAGMEETTILSIASGKGGVGKSTVTVNLGVALARLGKKVGIIDADIYGFSVPSMMGVLDRPKLKGNKIVPVKTHGVKYISMEFFVENNEPVIWRGPRLGKMLKSFFIEVEWGKLDYLLLDLPPGTGDMALSVHQMLPASKEIIVTTPHPTAAFVASRAGRMAINTDHEIIGVVENMAYFESQITNEREYVFGKGGGQALADELSAPLIAQIPLGQPSEGGSIYSEDHPIGIKYDQMAKYILTEKH